MRDWLRTHAPGKKIRLAYFRHDVPCKCWAWDYELPPLDRPAHRPRPSARTILGIAFPAPNAGGGHSNIPRAEVLVYSRQFEQPCHPRVLDLVYDLSAGRT